MAECLRLCEARLHQATDYQIVLQREAVERAKTATLAWIQLPAQMVKEELAHGIATWQARQQGLRAESLAAAAALHSVLVETKLLQDEEGTQMRSRQLKASEQREGLMAAFAEELRRGVLLLEERHQSVLAEVERETAAMVTLEEESGVRRVEQSRAALDRVDEIVAEADASVARELEVCDTHAEAEAHSRAGLVDVVYQRRLQRLCTWIAETEEDGRVLEEAAIAEEMAAAERDKGMTDEMGAISLVEARSRDLFDRARVEHITNVAKMHDELVPVFARRQLQYEGEMHSVRDELHALSTAAVSEHIATVRGHMAEVMASAAQLRATSRSQQAEVGTQLLCLHLERIEFSAEAHRAKVNHAYVEAVHAVRLRHAQASTTMEVAMLRERNTQHLGFNRIFASAADASWARERGQLLASVGALTNARQVMSEKLVALACQQTLHHYDSLAEQAERWADQEAADEAARSEFETQAVKRWEEEPQRTAQLQLASQRRLMATAGEMLSTDAEWFSGRLSEASAEGAKRADSEMEAADDLVHEAQVEWRKQVAEGFEADTKAHHSRLLEAEQKAHAEAVQRSRDATAKMEKMREQCAKALDGSAHRETLAQKQLQNARDAARGVSERTQEKLHAAHEALNSALKRTAEKVSAAVTSSGERVLKKQTDLSMRLHKASVEHTVFLEQMGRERHDTLLKAYEAQRAKHATALSTAHEAGLRAQEAECRAQLEAEESLASQVAQVKTRAREDHEKAEGEERKALESLWAEWGQADAKTRKATLERALEWQKRASGRFVQQLGATWARQLVHHANLCRETQRARRIAFEQRKKKRLESIRRLEQSFHSEQRESDAAMAAAREALSEEVERVPAQFESASQRALDGLTSDRLREVAGVIQSRYDGAAEAEKAQVDAADELMAAAAEESGLLLANLSSRAGPALGPPPNEFVRHAVSHALSGDEVANAVAWTTHWEAEQAADMHDGVEREVGIGLEERRERRREAAREAASRKAQREHEARQRAEEEELQRLAEEERKLASLTPAEVEAAAAERTAQAQLEWDARNLGAVAADDQRKVLDSIIHQRRVKRQQRRRAALESAVAMSMAAANVPSAAAGDLAGQGLRGEAALLVMHAANRIRANLQGDERAASSEAFTAFRQTTAAMRGRMATEIERVVDETRVRREGQISREIERSSATLADMLARLSPTQLLAVTDALTNRLARCSDRAELAQCTQQKLMLDRRQLSAQDLLSGEDSNPASVSAAAANLRAARMRLDNAHAECEGRLTQAEIAARLAAETPLQRVLREQMAKNVHRLSGVFAAVDASGDGMVDVHEFRRVLPVLAIEGATEADADAVFLNLSRGAPEVGYRDLFLELSRIQRQQQAEKAASELAATAAQPPPPPQPPAGASSTPSRRTPAASGAATPALKPTPRAASSGPKERPGAGSSPAPAGGAKKPATAGAKKAAAGGAKKPAAAGGAKKPAGGARSASAPKARGK